MANEVKKSKNTQKQSKSRSMVEVSFIAAAVEKGGKILDEMLDGKSILEYSLHEAEMSIRLDTNGIDKDGNRYDPETKYIISIKGDPRKPKANKKANIQSSKEDDERQ